jgi:hypothetical protein
MEMLQTLGVALGLASLSGVNLYLTVLLTGLAVRYDLLHLADRFQPLSGLAHPMILAVAGTLFLLQFLADKIPLLDSLWDSVHTIIRPVGATLIALQALGDVPVYLRVIGVLLAGSAALTTHGAKAGARLFINQSPEPFSNIAVSVVEDVAVAGGVALTLANPLVALAVFSVLLGIIWLLLPRIWRGARATSWLAWRKLKMPPGSAEITELPRELTDELRDWLRIRAGVTAEEVAWTVRCLSGRSKGVSGMKANLNGVLVGLTQGDAVCFATVRALRGRVVQIPIRDAQIASEVAFLSENVSISSGSSRAIFRFPRGSGATVGLVVKHLRAAAGRRAVHEFKPEPPPEAVEPGLLDSPRATAAAPDPVSTPGAQHEAPPIPPVP